LKSRDVRWSDQAISELEAVRLYILPRNRLAALRLGDRITRAAESLCEFPDRGRDVGGGVRQLSLIYPYLIRYLVFEEEVVITSVRHGARDES